MENYGTVINYQRTYGGELKLEEDAKVSKLGEFTIKFSRPIVFPNELLKEFDSEYVEAVPLLKATEAEKKELKKVYD